VIAGGFRDHSRIMNRTALLLCAVMALAGCHRDAGQPPAATPAAATAAKAPVAERHGPTPEEQTAGMVEAASQGKSQAPVTVKFDLGSRPAVGQPLEIAIALIPQIAAGATVEVSASPGLTLAGDESKFEFASVEPNVVYRHNVKLTPSAEGVLFVNLNVSLKHDELTDTRVFSFPVIVGGSGLPADTQVKH
jgi:hypothetical protein